LDLGHNDNATATVYADAAANDDVTTNCES
jgi:hypothetical protein